MGLVVKAMAGAKVENAPLRRFRGHVYNMFVALIEVLGLSLKAVDELARQNVAQVAGLVDSAFFKHWKRLVELPRRTGHKLQMS